jgi:SAM-dependent methyltransferase
MPDGDVVARRATSFGAGAQDYARGRPHYPDPALRWAVGDDARLVLDLAAGTGIVGAGLRSLGHAVVSVEPLAEMRALIPKAATPVGGRAEAIPLRAQAVDAVAVGQAFHWFQPDAATAEMTRVVRRGGWIGLLWLLLDDSVPWISAICDLYDAEDRASLLSDASPSPFPATDSLDEVERRVFTHTQRSDVDGLLANIGSRSPVLLLPDVERSALLDRVAALAPSDVFDVPYVCEVWRARSVG